MSSQNASHYKRGHSIFGLPWQLFSIFVTAFSLGALLLQVSPSYSTDYDHVELHCLPGGEGVLVFSNGSHDKVTGSDVSILLEYSVSEKAIVTLDIVMTDEIGGRAITRADTLKNLTVLDAVFAKTAQWPGKPVLKVGRDDQTYIIYNFLEDIPILVSSDASLAWASMTWQRCYVRSKYKVTR